MQPETSLNHFLARANYAPGSSGPLSLPPFWRPVIYTENALSLNNGVFFLQVDQAAGKRFFRAWREGCRDGEWPWADNGCMYEVLLRHLAPDRYAGACSRQRPEVFYGLLPSFRSRCLVVLALGQVSRELQ